MEQINVTDNICLNIQDFDDRNDLQNILIINGFTVCCKILKDEYGKNKYYVVATRG